MSKDIKVGDLVIVVKPSLCCGILKDIGSIFTVLNAMPATYVTCIYCHNRKENENYLLLSNNMGCHKSRLIKIDPPQLPEEITTNEPMENVAW